MTMTHLQYSQFLLNTELPMSGCSVDPHQTFHLAIHSILCAKSLQCVRQFIAANDNDMDILIQEYLCWVFCASSSNEHNVLCNKCEVKPVQCKTKLNN